MKTPREPGPLRTPDFDFWRDFQKLWGLQVDGKPGHQTTGQVAIVLGEYARELVVLKRRVKQLAFLLAAALGATGLGVLGSM